MRLLSSEEVSFGTLVKLFRFIAVYRGFELNVEIQVGLCCGSKEEEHVDIGKEEYGQCYRVDGGFVMSSINGQEMWHDVQNEEIIPPLYKKGLGRPRKLRIREYGEDGARRRLSVMLFGCCFSINKKGKSKVKPETAINTTSANKKGKSKVKPEGKAMRKRSSERIKLKVFQKPIKRPGSNPKQSMYLTEDEGDILTQEGKGS
ncbi:hypothetical protein KIW84_053740 [Lathyrus oleraceus]|uniref:Uncharacterized protein n=1 Tax=Pisum sativum TaxID=3888 RepID=A0A9D4WVW6_PEA|nr:hypothetical protein KIW84_053740 [Pisum sativum]